MFWGLPKFNILHTTKIIYGKWFMKILQRYNKGIGELGIQIQDFEKKLKIEDE